MRPQNFFRIVALAMTLLVVTMASAEASTGKIKGSVTDKVSGDPLVGVAVQIAGTSMGAMTNADGKYLINKVTSGKYTLTFSVVGYRTVTVPDVEVISDQTVEIDVEMEMAVHDSGKAITVTEMRKGIDSKSLLPDVTSPAPAADALQYNGSAPREQSKSSVNYNSAGTSQEISRDRRGLPYGGEEPKSIIRVPHPKSRPPHYDWWEPMPSFDAMNFQDYGTNPFIDTDEDRLSTFAIDVDDASYVLTRSYLERRQLPPADAIRVEEFINHFDYGYASPNGKPFEVYIDGTPSRFDRRSQMLRIGIKGREVSSQKRKPANLVFIIDVSGSMARENRLELVKDALRYLLDELEKNDRVGIVKFTTTAEEVLPLTSVRHRSVIFEAIDRLYPENTTNVEDGLRLGYRMARNSFDEDRINRIILCSDGVANTGVVDPDQLFNQIKKFAQMGIVLSTVGVGMGNYNDVLLETLGDKGNGRYAYIDNIEEARRVFVENLTGTLEVIARDVKIQVDFDPEVVESYRLLGYENRDVADNKFRDNRQDGGEIGAGHSVTALYEIRFREEMEDFGDRLGTVYVRYKSPDGDVIREISRKIPCHVFAAGFRSGSPQFRLAAASAEFAEILKGTYWSRGSSLYSVLDLARAIYEDWPTPEVEEFVRLVQQAAQLKEGHAER